MNKIKLAIGVSLLTLVGIIIGVALLICFIPAGISAWLLPDKINWQRPNPRKYGW